MKKKSTDTAFYLAGPTGCGKTGVAVALAIRLGDTEIINADAFQVYRGLEILTAAPTESEMAGITHHLFGILDLSETFDVAAFASRARKKIEDITARGRLPIVVGGSGLYLKALTHGLADTPPGDEQMRESLEKLSLDELVSWYRSVDPEGASDTNLQNRRYVTRNLEITLLSGQPASKMKRNFSKTDPQIRAVFLTREREDLYARVNRRTEQMFEEGVTEEVRNVDASEVSVTAERAIGLREIQALLTGEMTEPECIAAIQQATRRYAKRQETWFKREKSFQTVCIAPDETAESAAERILELFPGLAGEPKE